MAEEKAEAKLLLEHTGNDLPQMQAWTFVYFKNAYSKLTMGNILNMPETCAECGQRFHLEPGFWYGTGYVSYALTIVFSAVSFILWWLIIGFSLDDYRLFYWLIANAVLLIVLQPWLMRLSRSVYLRFLLLMTKSMKLPSPKYILKGK